MSMTVNLDWSRTNNACEGFNSGFQSLLSAHHPTIWKFIEGLKKQQNLTDAILLDLFP